jgi:hypothetical protein
MSTKIDTDAAFFAYIFVTTTFLLRLYKVSIIQESTCQNQPIFPLSFLD